MKTVVLQSFRTFDVPPWLKQCITSVKKWAHHQGWDYEWLDDRFFELVPDWVRERCAGNIYALTDICRLQWLRQMLNAGYERAIWVDADILVFAPERLSVTTKHGYAFAHELFLAVLPDGGIKPQEGLNNALMVFERDQPMLEFYHHAALVRMKRAPPGPIPRTALGPALLSDLACVLPLELLFGVGLFTLAIMREIAKGGGPLPRECAKRSPRPLGAANVCHFLRNSAPSNQRGAFDAIYDRAVSQLIDTRGDVLTHSI